MSNWPRNTGAGRLFSGLVPAAIEQVAGEASQFDFTKAVGGESARASVRALIGAAFVLVAIIVLSPAAAAMSSAAGLRRIAHAAIYARAVGWLAREQVVPTGTFRDPVRRGVSLLVAASRAVGQVEQQLRIPARREGSALRWRVPAQVQPGILTLRLGDARQRVRIQPLHRPSCANFTHPFSCPLTCSIPRWSRTSRTAC
ncbi:MAG: hypothetical protein U1G07_21175 [Verrucomicrobiota bacterium]